MSRPRILLADDTRMNREIVAALLAEQGYEVVAVEDGPSALAAFTKQPFDLVLLDVEMPGMSGPEVAAAIREADGRMPVLAMTGHRDESDRRRCLEAGMDEMLTKPVRPADLADAIRRATGATTAKPDWARAVEALGGREGLLRRMAAAFVEEAPGWMGALQAAIASGDLPGMRRAAHTLYGSLRYFDAARAVELADILVAKAKRGESDGVSDLVRELEAELSRLLPAIEEFAVRNEDTKT
ncbi:MAG: Hpt domain-containing response regulator [Planctomycetota bacterium]